MNKKFRRSLMGYKPEQIKELIVSIEKDIDKSCAEAEAQYQKLNDDIKILREKVHVVKGNISKIKELEEDIKTILMHAYLECCNKIISASNKAVSMEEEMEKMLAKREKVIIQMNEINRKMVEELKTRMEFYKEKVEAFFYGE